MTSSFRSRSPGDQVDTIGKTFLGLTVGCARCHDHKFDPIPHKDYYSLAGVLRRPDAWSSIEPIPAARDAMT